MSKLRAGFVFFAGVLGLAFYFNELRVELRTLFEAKKGGRALGKKVELMGKHEGWCLLKGGYFWFRTRLQSFFAVG